LEEAQKLPNEKSNEIEEKKVDGKEINQQQQNEQESSKE